ncbi:hypothetical protein BH09BAC4_BH09BAC4_36430 [soil metagenome]
MYSLRVYESRFNRSGFFVSHKNSLILPALLNSVLRVVIIMESVLENYSTQQQDFVYYNKNHFTPKFTLESAPQ